MLLVIMDTPQAACRVIQLAQIAVGQMIAHPIENLITLVDISVSSEFLIKSRGPQCAWASWSYSLG
ncbi:MAG: hypothetical protein IPG58_19345 [Acidobacteria bacterium]|nr:hypothetical protein [Acidobacteriota bacterium]MBP7475217.1 hypothetical protein [Pyrinomonadaceae bacterium]